jgi:WD40 repeat protein
MVVAFNHDGHLLATGGTDQTVRVWDAASGTERTRICLGDIVTALAFSHDSKWLAAGNENGIARVFSTAQGEVLATLMHARAVNQIVFNKDDTRIITKSLDKSVRVWKTGPWRELARLSNESKVYKIAISQNGNRLVTAGTDKIACVWSLVNGDEQKQISRDSGLTAMALSPAGDKLATADYDGNIGVWDAQKATELWSETLDGSVTDITYSSDGTLVGATSKDGTARIYNALSGAETNRFEHDDWVHSIVVSPDDAYVATGTSSSGTVHIWDLASGKSVLEDSIGGGPDIEVAFSRDGRQLLIGSGYKAQIWDIEAKNTIANVKFADLVSKAVFSPDAHLVATGNVYGIITIMDVKNGKEVMRVVQDQPVHDLIFSAGGTRLASVGDFTAHVWDVKSGREIARLPYGGKTIACGPDSRLIAIAGEGGVQLLNWRSQDLIDNACAHLSRNLSHSEWWEYLGEEPYTPTCPNLPVTDD